MLVTPLAVLEVKGKYVDACPSPTQAPARCSPRTSPILQEARVDIIDLDLCNSTMWYNGRIRSTNVCAGYPEGKIDTCQGDSGGPLMCSESVENSYVVVGITSWGVGCARAKRPGVYTSTWSYLNWIASKIGSNALHMIQLPTPPPPSTPAPPAKPTSTQPSLRPPWYFQQPPRPPPSQSPAARLQQLIEALKGKAFFDRKGTYEMETTDIPEQPASS
eukprot:bmy_14606T0